MSDAQHARRRTTTPTFAANDCRKAAFVQPRAESWHNFRMLPLEGSPQGHGSRALHNTPAHSRVLHSLERQTSSILSELPKSLAKFTPKNALVGMNQRFQLFPQRRSNNGESITKWVIGTDKCLTINVFSFASPAPFHRADRPSNGPLESAGEASTVGASMMPLPFVVQVCRRWIPYCRVSIEFANGPNYLSPDSAIWRRS